MFIFLTTFLATYRDQGVQHTTFTNLTELNYASHNFHQSMSFSGLACHCHIFWSDRTI